MHCLLSYDLSPSYVYRASTHDGFHHPVRDNPIKLEYHSSSDISNYDFVREYHFDNAEQHPKHVLKQFFNPEHSVKQHLNSQHILK